MPFKAEQPEKAELPISVVLSESTAFSRFAQSLNAESEISVTPFGSTISLIPTQPEKALLPTKVTESGSLISVIFLQL